MGFRRQKKFSSKLGNGVLQGGADVKLWGLNLHRTLDLVEQQTGLSLGKFTFNPHRIHFSVVCNQDGQSLESVGFTGENLNQMANPPRIWNHPRRSSAYPFMGIHGFQFVGDGMDASCCPSTNWNLRSGGGGMHFSRSSNHEGSGRVDRIPVSPVPRRGEARRGTCPSGSESSERGLWVRA